MEKAKNSQIQQLRDELTKAEEDLKEVLAREAKLKIELDEVKEALEQAQEEKRNAQREQEIKLLENLVNNVIVEFREDGKTIEQRMEDEKRAHNVRIEELHVRLTRATAGLEEAERNKAAFERKYTKLENNFYRSG